MPLCSTLLLAVGFGFGALPGVLGGVITDPTLVSNHTYDYIIVGGGLTGLTVRLICAHIPFVLFYLPNYLCGIKVAGRLTENPNLQVLVIEAGNDDRTNPVVYDIYRYGDAFGTKLDWSYPADQGRSIPALVALIIFSACTTDVLIPTSQWEDIRRFFVNQRSCLDPGTQTAVWFMVAAFGSCRRELGLGLEWDVRLYEKGG
jgi:hypothetical protein